MKMAKRKRLLTAPVLAGFILWLPGCGGGAGSGDADAADDAADVAEGADVLPDPDAADADGQADPDADPDVAPDPVGEDLPGPVMTVRLDPDDPHRFIAGGEPLFLVGTYPSIAALTGESPDLDTYYRNFIDRLEAGGLNYFRQVFTMGQPFGEYLVPYERTGPGDAADGRPRFDLERFDEGFFEHWRRVVEYAQDAGVVVQVTIFDTWHNKEWVVEDGGAPDRIWGMQYDFYSGGNNVSGIDTPNVNAWTNPDNPAFGIQQDLVRRAVDTLGDLPNIVWEICNENNYNEDWEIRLADFLTAYEVEHGLDPHLVMPRDLPNHDGAGGKGNDPVAVHAEIAANYAQSRPLIADNDGGGHVGPEGRRHKVWAALTAGGTIDYFHFDMREQGVLDSAEVAEGMQYLGLTRTFLNDFGVDLRGMGPADDRVSAGWCLAAPGERTIVYLMSGGSTTVDGLPASYDAWWFNPRDGSSMTAEAGPTFTASDNEDWVLFILATP
ncbi:MAG: hypothetical protein ABIJ56_13990 [Pseudomonadota bacterium]